MTLVWSTRLRHIYNARLAESRRERLFLASLGFFTAVLVVRSITVAIRSNFGPFHDVSMGGRHIHHLVWGILLLPLSGYGWLLEVGTGSQGSLRWIGRLMYGAAAALTIDEFALWLNLRDVYWQREERESFEAMALFGGRLAIGLFGHPLRDYRGQDCPFPAILSSRDVVSMPAGMVVTSDTASLTSSVTIENRFSHEVPKEVVMATSAASRPVAMRNPTDPWVYGCGRRRETQRGDKFGR